MSPFHSRKMNIGIVGAGYIGGALAQAFARLDIESPSRFEACFPFHPATLSVFQRK
jgi:2-polyprenyl-6-methoxyphenol hydroxylase-like FAD-dependent oxidoreductase